MLVSNGKRSHYTVVNCILSDSLIFYIFFFFFPEEHGMNDPCIKFNCAESRTEPKRKMCVQTSSNAQSMLRNPV